MKEVEKHYEYSMKFESRSMTVWLCQQITAIHNIYTPLYCDQYFSWYLINNQQLQTLFRTNSDSDHINDNIPHDDADGEVAPIMVRS